MGVYAEVRDFVLAHRACAGPRQANAGAPTVAGYRLFVVCGCGAVQALGDARPCGQRLAQVGAAGIRELDSEWTRTTPPRSTLTRDVIGSPS